jgi:hypothetical protein
MAAIPLIETDQHSIPAEEWEKVDYDTNPTPEHFFIKTIIVRLNLVIQAINDMNGEVSEPAQQESETE